MFKYKKCDRAALDRQYNNRLQVPEYGLPLKQWENTSRETQKKFEAVYGIAYSDPERERLHIYNSSKK